MSLLKGRGGGGGSRKRPIGSLDLPSVSSAPPPAAAASSSSLPNDDRLWIEKHAPQASKDLAVHKKKVDEVRSANITTDCAVGSG